MESPDVLHLIFEQLAGDYHSLCAASLVCHTWHAHSLPSLLQIVDLSSHNNVLEHDPEDGSVTAMFPDYRSFYRPKSLVPRQRAFLRLMTARPDLTKYVKSLVWTLVWMDSKDKHLTEIDRETWNVFGRCSNVTHLDLASVHEVWEDDFVRQNPAQLFPEVTDLRLLGWTHRGLVKAIIDSLDPRRLRSLKLDHLHDEGSLPDGTPLNEEWAMEHARSARRTDEPSPVCDDLYLRQTTGKACIFPGPMWLPLRLLAACPLDSLMHLQVKLACFDMDIDLRSYYSFFHETANLIAKARTTLTSLIVVFGESRQIYPEMFLGDCATSRIMTRSIYRPWCIRMAAAFLNQTLAVLNQHHFPCLGNVRFEGFHLLEDASPAEAADAQLAETFKSIQLCSFATQTFTEISSVDYHYCFSGNDCVAHPGDEEELRELLERS